MTEPVIERIPEDPANPRRLGRHVGHDPRSRAFAFRAPAGLDLHAVRWDRAVPIFDQGDLGSCTGNAAAGWLATANSLRPGMAEYPWGAQGAAYPVDEKLAVSIYGRATSIDPYDGDYPPTDSGSDGLSVTKVLKERGFVDSYQHAFDVASALAALQSGPVLIGSVWHEGMFHPLSNGLVTISGPVVGGHEYLAVGWDPDTSEVTFANSWGPGWGVDGYFSMTVPTLTALLADDGDCTIPHALVAAPVPDPVSPPTFLPGLSDRARARMASRARKRHMTVEDWVTRLVENETK